MSLGQNTNQPSNSTKEERYVGKVKQHNLTNGKGEAFSKFNVLIDNANPQNKDGTPNTYHKGSLLWFDQETGKYYQIKQMELAGVAPKDSERGFINSVRIDLNSQYHVTPIDG